MTVPLRADPKEVDVFLKKYPDIQFIDLLIADMNGVVRGKRIERASLKKVYEKGINLPASIFALDINGTTVESSGLGLDIGEADRICYPIAGTLSLEPWQKRPTAQLLMTMHETDGQPFFADPREILRQIVKKFDALGLTICAAFEVEFYLIDQENINGRPQPPRSPISGRRPQSTQVYLIDDLDEYIDCLQNILDGAKVQGIPADAIVKESAPAQFEVNLNHVCDALKACDYAILLKRLIKNIAYDHEMDSTFMAKPYPKQAGNGLHLHVSILDKEGTNIFTSANPDQHPILRNAVAGVLQTLPKSMAFLCPNVNSYRRFGAQFYVPNAPTWGLDNRTVAIRIPTDTPNGMRIEHRVAGADANPYLLMAALLIGIHHGLVNKLEPSMEAVAGNAYEQYEASLPNNLRDALRELDVCEIFPNYIDRKYIDVFVACKESELEEFELSISDLEYNWYLHTV